MILGCGFMETYFAGRLKAPLRLQGSIGVSSKYNDLLNMVGNIEQVFTLKFVGEDVMRYSGVGKCSKDWIGFGKVGERVYVPKSQVFLSGDYEHCGALRGGHSVGVDALFDEKTSGLVREVVNVDEDNFKHLRTFGPDVGGKFFNVTNVGSSAMIRLRNGLPLILNVLGNTIYEVGGQVRRPFGFSDLYPVRGADK